MATTTRNTHYSWSRRSTLYWALVVVAVIALIAFISMGRSGTSVSDGYSTPAANSSTAVPGSGTSGSGYRR